MVYIEPLLFGTASQEIRHHLRLNTSKRPAWRGQMIMLSFRGHFDAMVMHTFWRKTAWCNCIAEFEKYCSRASLKLQSLVHLLQPEKNSSPNCAGEIFSHFYRTPPEPHHIKSSHHTSAPTSRQHQILSSIGARISYIVAPVKTRKSIKAQDLLEFLTLAISRLRKIKKRLRLRSGYKQSLLHPLGAIVW